MINSGMNLHGPPNESEDVEMTYSPAHDDDVSASISEGKKRPLITSIGKLKKVCINAFGDEDEEETSKPFPKPPEVVVNKLSSSLEKEPSFILRDKNDEDDVITDVQLATIKSTASWIVTNKEKYDLLLMTSKTNPAMHFLYNPDSAQYKILVEEVAKINPSFEIPKPKASSAVLSSTQQSSQRSIKERSPPRRHRDSSKDNSRRSYRHRSRSRSRDRRDRRHRRDDSRSR